MLKETEVILRQMLLNILKAETLGEAQDAIKFLCSKEEVAEAEKIISEAKKNR